MLERAAALSPLLVVLGRARRLAVQSHAEEVREFVVVGSVSSEVRKTVGDVGAAFVGASAHGLMVVQARGQ